MIGKSIALLRKLQRHAYNNGIVGRITGKLNERKEAVVSEQIDNQIIETQGKDVLIYLDKGMGDFLLFAFYLDKLISFFEPDRKVFVLCDQYNIEFLKFCKDRNFNTICIQRREYYQLEKVAEVQDHKGAFELVIMPFTTITKTHLTILRNLKAEKIYSEGKHIPSMERKKLSDHDLKIIDGIVSLVNVNEEDFYAVQHRELYTRITGDDVGLGLLDLRKGDYKIENVCVINIGASIAKNKWAIENVAELIDKVIQHYKMRVIVIGEMNDKQKEVLQQTDADLSYANLRDIEKTIKILDMAKIIITNDTGIYHVAMNMGKNTVVIAHGSSNKKFLPYPAELLRGHVRYIFPKRNCLNCRMFLKCRLRGGASETSPICMREITAEEVFERLCDMLDSESKIYS